MASPGVITVASSARSLTRMARAIGVPSSAAGWRVTRCPVARLSMAVIRPVTMTAP